MAAIIRLDDEITKFLRAEAYTASLSISRLALYILYYCYAHWDEIEIVEDELLESFPHLQRRRKKGGNES